LNTSSIATLKAEVTRRIDQLDIVFSSWKSAIQDQAPKLEDRIETSFVQRDLHYNTAFEEVVKQAEARVQQAVQHGEQQLQAAAQHLQSVVRENSERITSIASVSDKEFGKHAAASSKHEHLLHDREQRLQTVEVQNLS
jgi:ElaB/YqjD/DUF883 family membrane-anchored ribosome-binding protein